jgi:hypothetical protein
VGYQAASSGNFVPLVAANCAFVGFLTTTRCVITQKSSVLKKTPNKPTNHPNNHPTNTSIHPSIRPSVLYQHRKTPSQSNINWPGTKPEPAQ